MKIQEKDPRRKIWNKFSSSVVDTENNQNKESAEHNIKFVYEDSNGNGHFFPDQILVKNIL